MAEVVKQMIDEAADLSTANCEQTCSAATYFMKLIYEYYRVEQKEIEIKF